MACYILLWRIIEICYYSMSFLTLASMTCHHDVHCMARHSTLIPFKLLSGALNADLTRHKMFSFIIDAQKYQHLFLSGQK